jgi:hypothetical protein
MAHDALAMIEYRDDPPACLFGDSQEALERIRMTADATGCRVANVMGVAAAPGSPRDCAPGAALLFELEGADMESAGPILDWAQDEAEAGARRVVISMTAPWIDFVCARTFGSQVVHLCGAGEAERIGEVAWASRMGGPRLHDIGRDEGSVILQQLSQDVGRIAAILASLSDEEQTAIAAKPAQPTDKEEPGIEAAFVRTMIRARRLREQFFRGGLFADPAWDMLLDLMAARLEDNRVAVSSLCIAAAVPATTALRWIKALTDRGLFVRSADPQDGRRVYIGLSDDAARALTAYLRAVQRMAPTAI